MGAGRMKETYTLAPDSLNTYVNWSVRNLEKRDLCGVIFGCKFSTIKEECYAEKLFGLPAAHMAYIKNIDPGLTLFLFNYSDRTLHGIFEAASEGQLNIDHKTWSPNGTDPSPYPAQVKMQVGVIADNYKDEKMFWFELDRDQTSKLLRMFSPPSPYVRASSLVEIGDVGATRVDKWSSLFKSSDDSGFLEAVSRFSESILEGLNMILEDPSDSFNSCGTRGGQLNIDLKAWSPNGTDPSPPYPAQVKMQVRGIPPHNAEAKKRMLLEGGSDPNAGDNSKEQKISVMERLVSKDQTEDWSILVHAGRCCGVDPGEGDIFICNVTFNDDPREDDNLRYDDLRAPDVEVYLGINSTREESIIGYLNTLTQPQLDFLSPIRVSGKITLAHSAYSTLRFSGYRYGHQLQIQPTLPMDKIWRLNVDLTTKIMSNIGRCADVARVELISKMFGVAGHNPSVYENVNLSNHAASQELTALMCMRRAAGKIRSFEIGLPGRTTPNYLYTRRVLRPFQYLGGLLTKLSLFGLPQLSSTEDLQPIFARCPLLTEFQQKNVSIPMPVNMVLQSVTEHCKSLEVLVYDNSDGPDWPRMGIDNITSLAFVGTCTRVKNLSLCGVTVPEEVMRVILEGLGRLEKLDLSVSRGFTGSFLFDAADDTKILRVIKLEHCYDLEEVQLRLFFLRLREGNYPNMRNIVVKSGTTWGDTLTAGFETRIGVADLLLERAIEIDATFEYANQEPEAWDDFFEEVNDQEAPNELNQEELMDGHEAQNELNQEELMDEEVEAMEEELFDEDDDSETDEEDDSILDDQEAQNELNQEELMDEEVEAMEEELFDEDDDSETDEEHNPIDHANRMQYIYWWG
ncbi:uncharacterized protein LOC108810426 isoform X2 [Raphanus sativus]|uniref:Uncharacterized protein LOC108810426 isoform X2 n=1 Tax=Raphanus sativus TaxID=3726 RepID=A0A9W3CL61_RAPSA|nr:uncharacterized protein LOC108810426 isoform X2 [Raphanus sativus]